MDIGSSPDRDFQFLGTVQTSGLAYEIFLTTAQKDSESDILRHALRIGAREFFPQPLNPDDVRTAFRKFLERRRASFMQTEKPPAKRGKIINVCGCKGGVGTTTVAVNLAASLIMLKGVNSVALVDMNPLIGDVPIFLNLKVDGFDWLDVSHNISRIDATYLDSIVTKHPLGIGVIPPPLKLIDENNQFIVETVETLFAKLRNSYDYIVIDGGRHFDEISNGIMKISDRVVMVAVLGLPYLVSIKRIIKIFKELGYPKEASLDIVVNRFEKGAPISLKDAEESIKKKIGYILPNNYKLVLNSINQGNPVVAIDKDSDLADKFRKMAMGISGRQEFKQEKTGFFGKLFD